MHQSDPEDLILLEKLDQQVQHFYWQLFQLGTGSRFHAFVEWCGVMQEHIKIVAALEKQGYPAINANTHTGGAPIPSYQLQYMAEKINCIFDGLLVVTVPEQADECDSRTAEPS